LSAPSGSGASANTGGPSGTISGSSSAFSIIPPYMTAVYLMRVK
jgi:hypothetical protein